MAGCLARHAGIRRRRARGASGRSRPSALCGAPCMIADSAPATVRAYLDELRNALKGASPGLISDALADAEEHLQGEIAANPNKTEAEVLATAIETFGSAQESAEEYRSMETAIAGPFPKSEQQPRHHKGFFGVISDPRAYGALMFMLLALPTG